MKKIKLETDEGQTSVIVTKPDSNESHLNKKKRKKKRKFQIQDSEVSTTTANVKEEMPVTPDTIKIEKPVVDGSIVRTRLSTLWLNYKPRSTRLISSVVTWHEQLIEETGGEYVDHSTKKELKQIAAKILEHDVENYKRVEEKNSNNDSLKFRNTVYNVGTFRDKLAAHVLHCMESPAHSLHHLNSILFMISPKAKNEFEEALDSVTQLLDSTLLPDNRVARKFESHSFSVLIPLIDRNREQAEKQLALWYFEDQLQRAYLKLISQLKLVASDSVDKNKITGIRSLVKLVKTHPGQDREAVLETVVNKLGDPSRKVASQAMHSLQHLLQFRPQVKESVVTIVEYLLYRPNVTTKTQYYCLCYLKDMIFKRSEFQLAAKLIKLYIGFFKACTKKGEVDTRMMGALLRGINRAFPYSRLRGEALNEQMDTLYKLCHVVNFAIATQALQLLYHVMTSKDKIEDRFYQVLYRQLQDPTFGSSSGNTAFLNLVFKAIMRDDSVERRFAFIKRLLQISQYQSPHLMCGILFLVSEVLREKTDMSELIETVLQSQVECDKAGDDFETFEDAEDEDELDEKVQPLHDFPDDQKSQDIKTELDDTKEGEETEDELDDIEEDFARFDGESSSESSSEDESSDDDNVKPDAKGLIKGVASNDCKGIKPTETFVQAPAVSSWFHRENTNDVTTIRRNHYDPFIRDPKYSGAHYSPLWELLFLKAHFHPSVVVFAGKIASKETIDYSGDPLQDFTLIRFLDRFVFKNPKKEKEKKEGTVSSILGSKAYYCPDGARGVAVNSSEFIELDSDKVPEDQQFFHSYFTKFKIAKAKRKDDDEESVGDDEFDEYLGKLGGASNNESDIDDDLDFAAGTTKSTKGGDDDAMESDEDNEFSDEDPVFEGESDGDDGGDEDGELDDGNDDLSFDEENAAFSDDDEDFSSQPQMKKGKSKKKLTSKKGGGLDSMFASADEFAHLLEENADEDTGLPTISSKALANKDKAHAKQLHWEVDRDNKISERDRYGSWKKRGHSKRGRGGFGSQRGSGNQRNFNGRGGNNRRGGRGGGPKKNFKDTRGRGSFKSKRGRR